MLMGVAMGWLMTVGDAFGRQRNQGGYRPVPVTNENVAAAAAFAVSAQKKHLQAAAKVKAMNLELLEIVNAEQQVVSGMNYRMQLRISLDGESRKARAVVWWQAWRRPDPYQLTDWTWESIGAP